VDAVEASILCCFAVNLCLLHTAGSAFLSSRFTCWTLIFTPVLLVIFHVHHRMACWLWIDYAELLHVVNVCVCLSGDLCMRIVVAQLTACCMFPVVQ